jgi:hypothetical protein
MKIKYLLLLGLIVFLTNCKKHKKEPTPNYETQPNTATSFFPFSNTQKWVYDVTSYNYNTFTFEPWKEDTLYYVKDTIVNCKGVNITLRKYQFTSLLPRHDIFMGQQPINNGVMSILLEKEVLTLYNTDSIDNAKPLRQYSFHGADALTGSYTSYFSNTTQQASAIGTIESIKTNTNYYIANSSNKYTIGQVKNTFLWGKAKGLYSHDFFYTLSKDTVFLPRIIQLNLHYSIKKIID